MTRTIDVTFVHAETGHARTVGFAEGTTIGIREGGLLRTRRVGDATTAQILGVGTETIGNRFVWTPGAEYRANGELFNIDWT